MVMKISLAGGVANTHYQIAKLLNRLDRNAFFVHEREGNFAFSQPVWEDASLTLGYEDTMTSSKWDRETWLKIERQAGWRAPDWIVDLNDDPNGKDRGPVFTGMNNIFYRLLEIRRQSLKKLRMILSNADLLVLGCGWAEIVAPFTGIPYVIWPSGGDMREAAGVENTSGVSLLGTVKQSIRQSLLRSSFEKAKFISSGNPPGMGSFIGCETLKVRKFEYFPFPLDPPPPIRLKEKKHLLKELSLRFRLELPRSETILFIPSRLDFFWKGLDRFLKAFTSLEFINLGVICTGWGVNRLDAMKMIREANMEKRVSFLDVSLSKPLLLDMFRAVDLVVDQFNLGAYGTAALEAMSVGTPVMMWIDEHSFRKAGMSIPPVLGVRTESEILNLLQKINHFEIDLVDRGRKSLSWIEEVHHYKKVLPKFVEKTTQS
jgi:glycosyltransferase involved in cell wall biosynthesis